MATLTQKQIWKRQDRIKRLMRIVRDEIFNLRLKANGVAFTTEEFRSILKKDFSLQERLDNLDSRLFTLKREMWRL